MKQITSYMVNLLCTCLLLVCCALLSCKKWVTVDLPIDKITASTVFQTDETATAAVAGIYSQMMSLQPFFTSGGTTVYAGLSADELVSTRTFLLEEAAFAENALTPDNGTVWGNFWVRAYQHIYSANACIEQLSASVSLTPAVKNRLLGEARFIRAFCYFYLVNLFGDVPLVTATAYAQNSTKSRTPAAEVYAAITEDLKAAKNLLPEDYVGNKRIRPNRWAAAALLARVYLYREAWVEAETEASAVINSGRYALETDPANVFLAVSNEALWQLSPVLSGFNTSEARLMIPFPFPASLPSYAIRPGVISSFEPGDVRKDAWLASKTVGGDVFWYSFKYKVSNIGLPVTENYTVLRLAELHLIRAEARAQQNNLPEAAEDLKILRFRAGLGPVTVTGKEDLLAAIAQERRIELLAEWGHRWFDLKRWGRSGAVLAPLKPAWQETDVLYPIPLSEILRNPTLTQNPGY